DLTQAGFGDVYADPLLRGFEHLRDGLIRRNEIARPQVERLDRAVRGRHHDGFLSLLPQICETVGLAPERATGGRDVSGAAAVLEPAERWEAGPRRGRLLVVLFLADARLLEQVAEPCPLALRFLPIGARPGDRLGPRAVHELLELSGRLGHGPGL